MAPREETGLLEASAGQKGALPALQAYWAQMGASVAPKVQQLAVWEAQMQQDLAAPEAEEDRSAAPVDVVAPASPQVN